MYLESDRRPPITPQLALRVAIIGGAALALFAIVFFRLWYLQILSGDRYLQEARANQVREIKIPAPRGEILDRDGRVLVDNRVGLAVKVSPEKLPASEADRRVVYRNLGNALGMKPESIDRRVTKQLEELPFSTAIVKPDVELPAVQYVLEHQAELPGVTVERVFLRSYPFKQVGAHLFGTVGEVTQEQLDQGRYQGVTSGDRVGQSGVEYTYDRFLRGRNGASRVQVDALGTLQGTGGFKEPVQGRTLRLAVDLDVQRVGQASLLGYKGGFVAMDVDTGEVIALGSTPSFDPNTFARVIRPAEYKRLSSDEAGAPLANRAIQGLYPTGSTFKLITATAATQEGIITPSTTLYDGGSLQVGGIEFKNAGDAVFGALQLPEALQVSSDVFFYQLGQRANSAGDGLAIQNWASRLGLGRTSGIDLPGEQAGLLPTPDWRNRLYKKGLTDRPWTVGDNINLSVGQGDLQANPLQMAVAYATLANGGTVVTPHLGLDVEDADGRVLQEFDAPPQRQVSIDDENRSAIIEGLRQAAQSPGGTSYDVFKDFPVPVAGKTGTAERPGQGDQSWYVALAPADDPQYVVAVTAEQGGFGAETAAPAARRILAALFNVKGEVDEVVRGSSQTL